MNYRIITIRTISTEKEGSLSFFEEQDILFDMRRFYYIYGASKDVKRGGHAHKELKQLLFCPYGKIKIELDDGKEKCVEILDDASKGILLEPGIWRDMYWLEDNSVLCVAVSEKYDENDYIRNYSEFLVWKNSII